MKKKKSTKLYGGLLNEQNSIILGVVSLCMCCIALIYYLRNKNTVKDVVPELRTPYPFVETHPATF